MESNTDMQTEWELLRGIKSDYCYYECVTGGVDRKVVNRKRGKVSLIMQHHCVSQSGKVQMLRTWRFEREKTGFLEVESGDQSQRNGMEVDCFSI